MQLSPQDTKTEIDKVGLNFLDVRNYDGVAAAKEAFFKVEAD